MKVPKTVLFSGMRFSCVPPRRLVLPCYAEAALRVASAMTEPADASEQLARLPLQGAG